jgi:uncharacterized protein (DUF58 family)
VRQFAWPTLAAVLVGLGLWWGVPWLVRLGGLVVGVGLVSLAWARGAPRAVGYERHLSAQRVFAGEQLTATVRLTNEKLLPLAWLRVDDAVPAALTFAGRELGAAEQPGSLSLAHAAALRSYDRLTWRYDVQCPVRGIYEFGPVRLETGDPFGLYRTTWHLPLPARLVVYPRIVPLAELGFPADAPFGRRVSQRSLERDPLRPVGVRPYQPGDSRRMVDWAATARTGQLQVKVLEPVSQELVAVVLNVATFEQTWIGADRDVQEHLIQVAGSIAHHARERGLAVGLVTNGGVPGGRRVVRVPPGSHPDAAAEILEALAGVTAFVAMPVERLVLLESRRLPWGATMVVVTALVGDALVRQLLRLRRAGRQVALVALDPGFRQTLPGVATYHVGPSVVAAAWAGRRTVAAAAGERDG